MLWKSNSSRIKKEILVIYLIAVLLLVLTSWIVAPLNFIYWINGLHTPVLDFIAALVTNMGNGVILVFLSLALLFFRFYLSVALAVNGILQGVVALLCKHIFFSDSLRPIAMLDKAMVHFVDGVKIHRLSGFPSGHTITAFGLAIFLSLCLQNRKATIALLTCAILVGLSRVYLLLHFLTDVAMGAAIGGVIGALTYFMFELKKNTKWGSQRITIQVSRTAHNENSVSEQ